MAVSKDTTYDGDHFISSDFITILPTTTNTLFDFRIGKIGSHILDLELRAAEAEGQSETISSPRVLTSNQKSAHIEVGEEIPYEEKTSSGATNIAFKKAVLSLEVTPQITPDDRIILDLTVNNDSRGQITDAGPAIDTNEVQTQVLVDNGETLVLGGVYTEKAGDQTNRTPVLGELPAVGWLFKTRSRFNEKDELLIFVTPKIVKEEFHI